MAVKLTSVTDSNNGAHTLLIDLLILMFPLSHQNVMNMLYIIRVLYKSRIYIYNSWYAIYIYNSWQIPQNAIYIYNLWQIPPERNLYI